MPISPYNLRATNLKGHLPEVLGDVIFVDSSTGNANSDGSSLRPINSIENALNKSGLSAGDTIVILPGHTETISSATALNFDTAGVRIVGLGTGSRMPTLTLDTAATATIPVTAANMTIENVKFVPGFADITAVFTLTTATYFTIRDCYFDNDSANSFNFLSIVDTSTTDNAADGLKFENCTWIEPDTETLYMVKADADLDSLTVIGGYVNLGVNTNDLPALAAFATGKDATNVQIDGVNISRLNDANPLVLTADTTTANTGYVANCYINHRDTASELLVTAATNIGHFNNLCTAVADKSGYAVPAVDS